MSVEKPKPEDFGYEPRGLENKGGWEQQGGEEAYFKALHEWELLTPLTPKDEAEAKADASIGIFPELTEKQKREIACIKDAAYHAGYEQRKKEDNRLAAKDVLYAIDQRQGCLEMELRELPELIQSSSYELLHLTCSIEIERKKIAEKKMETMTLISEIKEVGKPKYSNSDMREAAVKASLKDNPEYCTSVDALARLEYHQRKKQIDIEFFQNKFAACRSIAALRGVK